MGTVNIRTDEELERELKEIQKDMVKKIGNIDIIISKTQASKKAAQILKEYRVKNILEKK